MIIDMTPGLREGIDMALAGLDETSLILNDAIEDPDTTIAVTTAQALRHTARLLNALALDVEDAEATRDYARNHAPSHVRQALVDRTDSLTP